MSTVERTAIQAHAWERQDLDHYVEPFWCSERLFQEEKFSGPIWDPCCGFGRIIVGAVKAGYIAVGTDIADRGFADFGGQHDFLASETNKAPSIVCNPPFKVAKAFALKALALPEVEKVAMIFPTARLNAAGWLRDTPLARVWLMTPRPSMPPGHVIAAGKKPGGGKIDFCWLVWTRGRIGPADVRWLRRDA